VQINKAQGVVHRLKALQLIHPPPLLAKEATSEMTGLMIATQPKANVFVVAFTLTARP
jgi:hypothetical protein